MLSGGKLGFFTLPHCSTICLLWPRLVARFFPYFLTGRSRYSNTTRRVTYTRLKFNSDVLVTVYLDRLNTVFPFLLELL